jgi:hypothetical protein
MRIILVLLSALLAVPALAGPDCTDPYILARRVPECAGAAAAAPTVEDLAEASQSLKEFRDSPEFAGIISQNLSNERARKAMAASGFDGGVAHASPAAVAVPADWGGSRPSLVGPVLEPSSSEIPTAHPEVPAPTMSAPSGATEAEATRYKLSAALFHGTWLVDLISTIKVIRGGGFEMDPIYTLFGATNLVGVVLSMIAFHVLMTLLQRWAYRKLQTLQGEERTKWERLMFLFNLLSISHAWGAVHNAGVLSKMNR